MTDDEDEIEPEDIQLFAGAVADVNIEDSDDDSFVFNEDDIDSDSDSDDDTDMAVAGSSSDRREELLEDDDEEDDEVVKAIIAATKKARVHPPDIITEDFVVDLSFHPEEDLLAVGTITGDVLIYKYSNDENILVNTIEVHTKAVRDIEFNPDGSTLYSTSKDKCIMLSDVHTGQLKRFYDNAHETPVYKMNVLDMNVFATGTCHFRILT